MPRYVTTYKLICSLFHLSMAAIAIKKNTLGLCSFSFPSSTRCVSFISRFIRSLEWKCEDEVRHFPIGWYNNRIFNTRTAVKLWYPQQDFCVSFLSLNLLKTQFSSVLLSKFDCVLESKTRQFSNLNVTTKMQSIICSTCRMSCANEK